MSRAPVPAGRRGTIVIGLLIAAKVALLFLLAWNRRFVMDEFAQLGWARYVGHGLFDTIWPSKAAGFTAFIKLAHLIGWDAHSILLAGRMQTALLACATLAIVYACARALGESRARSALILLVLLSFSNFIERIFETRAEPLAVFFGAAALLVAMRGNAGRSRVIASGFLCGLAFVATQKAVYLDLALGLALVGDAVFARRFADGVRRGCWLVAGWLLAVAIYCAAFGGADAPAVARNLYFGPLEVASSQTADAYGGLRAYVMQTLLQNALLYAFCLGGLAVAALQFRVLDRRARLALIFTIVITVLVFAHNQPWPYVFVMALPFMALWALRAADLVAERPGYRTGLYAALAVAVALSFARNIATLQVDNHAQLALVARAERLTAPDEIYFDGIGMLPNRPEPSTVWLDRPTVIRTLREGKQSQMYRSLLARPPKVILTSYRTESVAPLIDPLMMARYVRIAPNTWITGRRLEPDQAVAFDVPAQARYGLYDRSGKAVAGAFEVDGQQVRSPALLPNGIVSVRLPNGTGGAFLLPQGSYAGAIDPGADNAQLFARIYD